MGKFLSDEQRLELERELRLEHKRKYADRIRVILLLDRGETYANIAKFLFLDGGTIANYRKRYKEGGLEGLIIDDYNGRRCVLNEKEQQLLVAELQSKIYLSTKDIIAYVELRFGVSYSVSGITELLHRLGFSYKKARPVPGKANRQQQEKFIELYNTLQSRGKVYFADSTHPQHNPVISYGWIKTGENHEVFTNSGRFHLNINGAVDIENLDVITRTCDWVNADAICNLLKAIWNKNHKVCNREKIYLVLDNARYNRAAKVKKVARELGIKLVYLPPYSPNLNPIERLWKFFKKKVMYNQYYETFDQFFQASSNFFKYIRKHRDELSTLLTGNFQAVGT